MFCTDLRNFLILPALALIATPSSAQEEAIAEAVVDAIPTAEASAPEYSDEQNSAKPRLRPLTIAAGLSDDSVITGTLLDSTALSIKTAFGEAAIPLSEVAGVRFPAAEDTSTTVVMLNGDSITGATDIKFINVETTWGNAKINGPSIATMLFVPGLRWQATESLGGKRWQLTEATQPPVAPSTQQPQAPVQQASGPQPIQNSRQPRIIFGQ